MTEATYTVVGTSNLNGQVKVRFANDIGRVKVLTKNGHTDVVLIQVDEPLTKLAGAQFISELDEFQSAEQQVAITELIEKLTAESKPKEVKPKATKTEGTVVEQPAPAAPAEPISEINDADVLAAAEAVVAEVVAESQAEVVAEPEQVSEPEVVAEEDQPY